MKIIKSKILSKYKELIHGVSSKIGLDRNAPFYFNLSFTVGDDPAIVEENRRAFFSELGVGGKVVLQKQTHSDNVAVMENGCVLENNDALITAKKNLALAVSLGDCTPILIYDKESQVIAAVHSGWRGTEKKILLKTLNRLKDEFNSKPENLIAYVGPAICRGCYEVGNEVAGKFDGKYVKTLDEKYYLDVSICNFDMLIDFGVPEVNIEYSGLCSYEEDYLHSYRRDGNKSGRMLAVIMMKGNNE